MKNPHNLTVREKLAVTFLFLYLCIAIFQLFRSDPMDFYNKSKEVKNYEQSYAMYLQNRVQQEKLVYTTRMDSLNRINDSLSLMVNQTDKQLISYRSKNASLRFQLQSTIAYYNTDTTLLKDAVAFDSLAGISTQYIAQTVSQDSLCHLEISLLKGQMENRDTALFLCNTQTELLEQDFFLLSKSHERVTEELSFTEKKLRRQTFKKRLYQGVALIISGVCVTFYLTHH